MALHHLRDTQFWRSPMLRKNRLWVTHTHSQGSHQQQGGWPLMTYSDQKCASEELPTSENKEGSTRCVSSFCGRFRRRRTPHSLQQGRGRSSFQAAFRWSRTRRKENAPLSEEQHRKTTNTAFCSSHRVSCQCITSTTVNQCSALHTAF